MTELFHYFNNAFTYAGRSVEILPGSTITLYDNQTDDPLMDVIYGDAAGLTIKTNGFPANSSGDIEFWLATPKYVRVKIQGVGAGAGTVTMDFQPVMPDPASIMSRRVTNAVYVNDPIYSNGLDIAGGAVDANPAFLNAFAEALSMSSPTNANGLLVLVAPGIYRVRNLVIPDGVVVVGAGDSTTFWRKNYNEQGDPATNMFESTVSMFNKSCPGLMNCRVNGNYQNNKHDTYGCSAAEIYTGMIDSRLENVHVSNYNFGAVNFNGIRSQMANVKAIGVMASTYKPDQNGNGYTEASADYGSFYGFLNSAFDVCKDSYAVNCYAEGIRTAGWTAGGQNLTVDNLKTYETHRGESFVVHGLVTVGAPVGSGYLCSLGATTGPTRGGSQVAFSSTVNALGDNPSTQYVLPTNVKLRNPTILQTSGKASGGLEVNAANGMMVIEPFITSQWHAGIFVGASSPYTVTRTQIIGGIVIGCAEAGISLSTDALDTVIVGTRLNSMHNSSNTAIGLQFAGNADYIQAIGVKFEGNDINYDKSTSTATKIDIVGPQVADGTPVPGQFSSPLSFLEVLRDAASAPATTIKNTNAAGSGLRVDAGTTTSHAPLDIRDKDANQIMFASAGTAPIIGFNTRDTSSAVRRMLSFAESSVVKYYLGLTDDDSFGVIDLDTLTVLLKVAKTTGLLSGAGLNYDPTTFSPILQQGGVTISHTKTMCEFFRMGQFLHAQISLVVTAIGAAAAGNVIRISNVPAAIQPVRVGFQIPLGFGFIIRSTVPTYRVGAVIPSGAADWQIVLDGESSSYSSSAGVTPSFRLEVGDTIAMNLSYKIA